MKHNCIFSLVFIFLLISEGKLYSQTDTTGIYGERYEDLDATVFVGSQEGNYLARGKDIRTEVVTAAGLCKMACCSLAESFENSASVTVGYSDAVTGARQIRLLGQNGIYTQMLDENRPVMRGLSAPFGLNYVPGQWLNSIQVAKGVTSVINGVESMTGQIDLEHRKPTDEKPLYVQASVMNDSKCDLNVISSLQFDELQTWSTVFLAHLDGNFKTFDMNGDGFMDDPEQLNISLSNRWLYFGQNGVQVRFGLRGIQDHRLGGQMESLGDRRWQADITNRSLNGYVKVGVPLDDDGATSIALILDATSQFLDSSYGNSIFSPETGDPFRMPYHTGVGFKFYNAFQQSFFANLLYQKEINDHHKFTVGLSDMLDLYSEAFCVDAYRGPVLNDAGVFGEYTYRNGDIFSAIVGLRGDLYSSEGFRFTPRVTLKYSPTESLVFRANGGRGLRFSTPLVDNFGVMSSAKTLRGAYNDHPLEDSFTVGANATWYLPFGEDTYLSFDYFHNEFQNQMVVDYDREPGAIWFYEAPAGTSWTDNYQLDFSTTPVRGLTLTLTGRYTNAHQSFLRGDIYWMQEKPMTSRYKGVFNAQYATRLNKWIFDFTASINGPCRVWDFMKDLTFEGKQPYSNGYTPAYPLLYAQLTRRFKGIDIYFGGENLTNYSQPFPIIGADAPFDSSFDASCVWGPIMGIRIYGGIRFTLWKTEKI